MTTVFGNPGSTEMGFFGDWPDDLRYVLALQEATAVAMADGWAQATRNAAFVNVHSAAGLGNALGNLFTAYRNRTPMVILAGQQHRALFPHEPFLFADQATAFPRPYVKWAVEPARAEDVPGALARAYLAAMQAPRGPTFVSVPMDDWDAPAEAPPSRSVTGDPRVAPDALAALADALAEARSPVLVVGAEVDAGGGFDDAVRLAETAGTPVWAAPRAPRASFPEDHPAFAGFLPFDPAGVRTALDGHDLIVVAGAPVFTYHVASDGPGVPPGARLVQLTDDPDAAARAEAGDALVGAVAPALRELVRALGARGELPTRAVHGRAPAPPPERPGPGEPLRPAWVLARLAERIPRDAAIVEEAPSHRHALHGHLPIRRADGFYTGASGGLGWAMPAAVGVQLAEPSRPVACLVGDGSAMYSPQALWSAARHGAPVVFVVMNNGGYGAMKAFAALQGVEGGPSYDLTGLSFEALAAAHGVVGRTASDAGAFDAALDEALARAGDAAPEARRPTLIDVRLAPETPTFA
jgi:benzoylformate decarboxylase